MKSILILILIFFIFSCNDKPMIIEPLIMPYFKTSKCINEGGSATVNGVLKITPRYEYIYTSIGFTVVNYKDNVENNIIIDNLACKKKDSLFKFSDMVDIHFFKKSKITNSKHLSEVQPRDLDRYSYVNDYFLGYSWSGIKDKVMKVMIINGKREHIWKFGNTSCLNMK
jgi:hypothetical protein